MYTKIVANACSKTLLKKLKNVATHPPHPFLVVGLDNSQAHMCRMSIKETQQLLPFIQFHLFWSVQDRPSNHFAQNPQAYQCVQKEVLI